MPVLRDGSESKDPRLTRIPFFDPNSWNYKVRDLFTKDRPLKSKTWRCMRTLDQGREGACTGFAVAHELIAQPSVVRRGVDAHFAKTKIYWEAQKIDRFKGGSYPGADPYMEGSSVLAAMKIAKRLGYISEYRWAFGIEDVKKAISEIGPVVLGIPWYEGMFDPASCGKLHPIGEKVGAHAILARGIHVPGRKILLHNSWGSDWGDNGCAWISWDDLAYCLRRGGEACIPTKRTPTVMRRT